jgi:hypothetical protein
MLAVLEKYPAVAFPRLSMRFAVRVGAQTFGL